MIKKIGRSIVIAAVIINLVSTVAAQGKPSEAHGRLGDENANMRDPFVSPIDIMKINEKELLQAVDLTSSTILNGILWSEQRPLVIIGGKVLGEGDEMDGLMVKKISREKVILEYKGREFELSLKKEEVK